MREARNILVAWIALLLVGLTAPMSAQAQEFSVSSFRMLPNDVSAFVNPIRDLNGEACALIKVVAPADFAFSSPLGIVSRKDEVGEIWLYLPQGTKTLTIKHPEWGVIRDYKLGKPLEGRITYEIQLNMPQTAKSEQHDTIVLTKTIVDTVTIDKPKVRTPLSTHILLTSAWHQDGPSWGIMVAMMWRHGFFVHASSDLKSIGKTLGTCDKEGNVTDNSVKPYYTGQMRHSHYTVTLGAIHHITHGVCLFEGIGYGRAATAWQQSESEGGGYLLNEGLTHKGMAAEVGVLASFGRISVSASAITIAAKQWQGCIGIGIKLGKKTYQHKQK